jgi:dTDP-4-dehydrorhamnose 3,5-epimerase
MNFEIETTSLPEVKIVKPKIWKDNRGYFTEVFNANAFMELGLPHEFQQISHSFSTKGVVRGLHFQWNPHADKLMRITRGKAFMVAVDIRKNSPSLGKWYSNIFDEETKHQLWAPAGFARGFCAISDYVEVQYLITGVYTPSCESEIAWNDKDLKIDWPVENPILSEKDKKAQSFKEWLNSELSNNFRYED